LSNDVRKTLEMFSLIAGLIQDEILYLNKIPDCRERIGLGLELFEKRVDAANKKILDNKVIDALKSVNLNR